MIQKKYNYKYIQLSENENKKENDTKNVQISFLVLFSLIVTVFLVYYKIYSNITDNIETSASFENTSIIIFQTTITAISTKTFKSNKRIKNDESDAMHTTSMVINTKQQPDCNFESTTIKSTIFDTKTTITKLTSLKFNELSNISNNATKTTTTIIPLNNQSIEKSEDVTTTNFVRMLTILPTNKTTMRNTISRSTNNYNASMLTTQNVTIFTTLRHPINEDFTNIAENVTQKMSISSNLHSLSSPAFFLSPTPPTIVTNKISVKTLSRQKTKPQRFYVQTENCRMPYVDPFTTEVKKIFRAGTYQPCSKEKALVTSKFDVKQNRYVLHINTHLNETSCVYYQIVRTGSGKLVDKKSILLSGTVFHQDFVVPTHIDYLIVECKSSETNKTLQKDAFSFIQKSNLSSSSSDNSTEKLPSVLLIGIDSLSRFNFRRNMKKTMSFLEENKWIELEGYNKVGDNTFPNLMPLLTGLNESKSFSNCNPKTVGGLDKCEFIWDHYKKHGYKTAYAEDTASLSTFNYLKLGFQKQPTDYYLRPMMLAIEKDLKVVKKHGLNFCVGRKQSGEYIYDFGLEFAQRLSKEPKFGLFWTNSFSHNHYATASTMDVPMRDYLKQMKDLGILEKSIVLFFSDHGRRWGPLLDLPEGFLEERLPMFFISLPKWFQNKYPHFVDALKINQNRLVTPFDIYQTLKQILNLENENSDKTELAKSCSGAQSIFKEIPKSRTCEEACIPEHYCTCDPYEVLSKSSSDVRFITDLMVNEINVFLKLRNLTDLCSKLTKDTILQAELKSEQKEIATHFETVRIKFKTKPKGAKFQATAVYDLNQRSIKMIVDDVSRFDSYEPFSKCINDKLAKKFCICKK